MYLEFKYALNALFEVHTNWRKTSPRDVGDAGVYTSTHMCKCGLCLCVQCAQNSIANIVQHPGKSPTLFFLWNRFPFYRDYNDTF